MTYYSKGNKISEVSALAGTLVSVMDNTLETNEDERFIGWSTASDMSGAVILPGSNLTLDRHMSLYAMILGNGTYAVILPSDTSGFNISADPLFVKEGGSSIISYSVKPSHTDEDLVISVNGNPMKLDALKNIHLLNITEDKIVTVSGVYDKREHSITLPEDQVGYVLTSSAEKVHHGESYTLEYRLLQGYKESSEFGIRINGGDAKRPLDGLMIVNDVRANHELTVTGVEPIYYKISLGKNISALIEGKIVSEATIEDLVTIVPKSGYSIPNTFKGQIKGDAESTDGGYLIKSDVVFPSVLKITAGDNIRINSANEKSIFVCPSDKVVISPASGYSMPSNYNDRLGGMGGVTVSPTGFTFTDDLTLPSIYKVVFNGHNNKIHETFFVTEGSNITLPKTSPTRNFYLFKEWIVNVESILEDTQIYAAWTPEKYTITFGKNITYFINEVLYDKPGTFVITYEDTIKIHPAIGYELPPGFLGGDVFLKNGSGYNIISDYKLPDIYFVQYKDSVTNLSEKYYYSNLSIHDIINPRSQKNTSFTFDLSNTDYKICDFEGWFCDGVLYYGGTITVTKDLLFYSSWADN